MTVIDHAEMLEVLLASCALWQSLTGTATVEEAREYIHQYECEESELFPRATVMDGVLSSGALATGQFGGSGTLYLRFDLIPDASLMDRGARRDWVHEQVLTLKQQMEVLSYSRATPTGYSVSHLVVRRITLDFPPQEMRLIDQPIAGREDLPKAPVWVAQLAVEW